MKREKILRTAIVLLGLLPLILQGQDTDQDGIADQLEANLAARFAPEWRFHKSTGTGSNQNEDEEHFPSSIEWLYNYIVQQTGVPPQLEYVPTGAKAPIANISNLSSIIVPGTGITAGDPSWGNCNNGAIRITDYPEKIPGDPTGFPTYYHCYPLGGGKVSIGFLLFYPYDYKGSYCVVPNPLGGCLLSVERGQHRGDWEGINVVVSNIADLNNPASAQNAILEYVKFSGHGSSKYINSTSPRFRSVNTTHPKVYIAWGSHTTYPEPGNFTDYKLDLGWGLINWYDDYFYGNGLTVQSWLPGRTLVNLGETGSPKVGWLNFKGWWGPDDNGDNSSPPGPPCKSPWTADIAGYVTWEEALTSAQYSQYWENAFDLDCSPELAMPYSPDPGYNCQAVVDCRVTCPANMQFPVGSIAEGVNLVAPNGILCILPCNYPETLTISKPMTLKAHEGIVVIGAQ